MLHILSKDAPMTVEQKLMEMRSLYSQIKELDAYFKMLREQVIVEHFNKFEKYINNKGRTLASYIMKESQVFQSAKFKKAHPNEYKDFCEKKISFTFTLSK